MNLQDLEVPNAVASVIEKPINELTCPPAKYLGKTIENIFELVFGGFNTFMEKIKIGRTKNIEDFHNELYEGIEQIPKENLVEPKLHIVGPALEASKYYYDEKVVRSMFTKLITSSLDNRKNKKLHKSFVEVIKQLEPIDAQNLCCFTNESQLPLAEFRYVNNETNHYDVMCTNVFIANTAQTDVYIQAVSITALVRAGLITTTYSQHLADESKYKTFETVTAYRELENNLQYRPNSKLEIEKGMASVTAFGKNFIDVCLS